MFRATTYRLHSTDKQQWGKLLLVCRACRFAYNEVLRQVREEYMDGGKPDLNHFALDRRFSRLRNSELHTWLRDVSSRAVSYEMKHLAEAFKGFFRRVASGSGKPGYPRLKSVRRDRNSFTIVFTPTEKWLQGRKLKVPKVGWLRLAGNNPHSAGRPKQATVYQDAGKWYASVLYELPDALPVATPRVAVGIDRNVGQITVSDGRVFRLPDRGQADRNICRYSRQLARKRRKAKSDGRKFWESRRYRRTQEKLQKWHRRGRSLARNWAHQTSRTIASTASRVIVEDLKVPAMVRKGTGKRKLNRDIMQSAWGMLVSYLVYKCHEVVKVNPAYTSQTCHHCGHKDRKNRSGRQFVCRHCGNKDDADVNAALNIRALGIWAPGHGAVIPATGAIRAPTAALMWQCYEPVETGF